MKLSVRLLEQFDWRGPAMVEYKLDGETGEAFLMEVNGRFWGSLQLAIDAGVDFPRLLVDAALGKTMPQAQPYRAGVRSRWWWGDVDHLLTRMRHGRTALSLPDTAPGRLRVLADFIAASGPRSRNEVLQWSDPMPMVRESLDWFRRR